MSLNINVNVPPRLIEQAREQQVERRLAMVQRQRQAAVRKEAVRKVQQERLARGLSKDGKVPVGGTLEQRRRQWDGATALLGRYEKVKAVYKWTDGLDLDTKTGLLGYASDGFVGWGWGGSKNYLQFSGDDTSGNGKETVDIDAQQIRKEHPGELELKISLAANWYEQNSSKPITIEIIGIYEGSKARKAIINVTIDVLYSGPGKEQDCGTVIIGANRRMRYIDPVYGRITSLNLSPPYILSPGD